MNPTEENKKLQDPQTSQAKCPQESSVILEPQRIYKTKVVKGKRPTVLDQEVLECDNDPDCPTKVKVFW